MVRIAVLDDNEQSRKELCDVLTRQPVEYQVESFASSKDLMAAGSFDIAFVDVVMKQESGIDAAGEIAAEQPGCKIIFCTSFPEYAPDIYAVRHTCLVTNNRLEELVPLALRRAHIALLALLAAEALVALPWLALSLYSLAAGAALPQTVPLYGTISGAVFLAGQRANAVHALAGAALRILEGREDTGNA